MPLNDSSIMTSVTERLAPGAYRYTIPAEASGMRLDQFLASYQEGLSRSLARRFIEIGGVHLEGRRMRRCSLVLAVGQRLELFVDGFSLTPFELEPHHILYQDRDILVINKPAGIVTQPTPARYRGTLYDALVRYLAAKAWTGRKPSLGMVQRLDRDTSGAMIFSIHPHAHKNLTRIFREHQVVKTYLALVGGVIDSPSGVIRSQLARRRSTNRTVSVKKGGRYAETHFEVDERLGDVTLIKVRLITGRTHQIRAHFAENGHPLVGDVFYDGIPEVGDFPVSRQMLHARNLTLDHPTTGQRMTFNATLPNDFMHILKHLGSHAC